MSPSSAITVRAIRTPRAAAVAGLVFSLLFAASIILRTWAIPPGSEEGGTWLSDSTKREVVLVSLRLLPFAGIAFLWFIGVLRDRIGEGEDRFFATVFLGSGLLFVAMVFVSGAISAALISTATDARFSGQIGSVWSFGHRSAITVANVYGMRMAAVFTLSASTIASRLGLVPRWLTLVGYGTALVLLLGGRLPWMELIFPGWVFVLSIHVLVVAYDRDRARMSEP